MNEIDLIRQKKLIESKSSKLSYEYNIPVVGLAVLAHIYQVPAILSIIPFYLGFAGVKLVKKRANLYQDLQTEIRRTDTYKILVDEYQSYIGELATFFQQQGITDSKEVNVFYQNLLNLGYLSYQNNYTYDFEYVSDNYRHFECMELEGARVVDGTAVCRHTSMTLKDLQNQLGNNCYQLDVSESSDKLLKKILKCLGVPNHTINLLEAEDNSFYGYCSTRETFLNIRKEGKKLVILSVPSSRNQTTSSVLSYFQSEEEKWRFFHTEDFINQSDNVLNEYYDQMGTSEFASHIRLVSGNMTCPYNKELNIKQLNPNEIMNLEQKIIHQTIASTKEIKEFYNQTKGQLYRIHSLYNSIVPLTNEKIKKLVIK